MAGWLEVVLFLLLILFLLRLLLLLLLLCLFLLLRFFLVRLLCGYLEHACAAKRSNATAVTVFFLFLSLNAWLGLLDG